MLSVLRFKNIGGSINGKFLNQKIKGKATGEKGCWSGTNNKLNLACNTWTYHWQKTWRLVTQHEVLYVLLLLLLLMFMSRRCQASYFTVAQALPIVLPSISPYTFLRLVAKFVGKLETTLRIAQLLSANCELPNEVATFIRHELDSELRDRRNTLFFFCLCSNRVNPVLLSLPGKASRCCFFHRYVIFNNKWHNHFFGFDFKGYKPMPNEAFPRIASTLGHTTGKGCTRAWICLCNGYFIDCFFDYLSLAIFFTCV